MGIALVAKSIGQVSNAPQGGEPQITHDQDFDAFQMNTKLGIKLLSANYTVVNDDSGKVLIARAAITITFPAAASRQGMWAIVINGTDTDLSVAFTANELTTFNDVDADAVALSTSSEKAGGGFLVVCDGTRWYALPLTEETQTVTVTT